MSTREHHNACRDERIHVCVEMCSTCIFRPGNLMELRPGRLRGMVAVAKRRDSAIICHKTLGSDNAICKGFYDRFVRDVFPLRLGSAMGLVEWQEPPN